MYYYIPVTRSLFLVPSTRWHSHKETRPFPRDTFRPGIVFGASFPVIFRSFFFVWECQLLGRVGGRQSGGGFNVGYGVPAR